MDSSPEHPKNLDHADPMDHVRTVVRRSGSSFFWAMRTLPEAKRDAMFAIYAFCREVDDIADDPGKEGDKRVRLTEWRQEIERLYDRYAGKPTKPVARALTGPIERFELHKEDFLAVIDGMEMDAGDRLRISDTDELGLYCDRVACAVGRLSNQVFGLDRKVGDALAHALGNALQLTNILRDVAEDAERDRLYLPEDMLAAYDIEDSTDLKALLAHPHLPEVCELLAEVAVHHFHEAEEILKRCDAKTVRPAVIMKDVYSRIFHLLQARGWEHLDRPVKLSKAVKLWIALRHSLGWV